jgi:SAM-dependent methyltransferase
MTITAPDVSTSAGLLRLGNAFCDAKALLTAVDLDLFTSLHDAPGTVEEIRDRLGLHGRGLSDFLHLLAALDLLEKSGDRFGNAPGPDRHLVKGQPGYIGGFLLRSDRNLYPAWGKLGEALRTGKPQSGASFEEMTQNPAVLRQFIGMMDALNQQLTAELQQTFQFQRYGSVLDLGGCRGNLVTQLVQPHPQLTGRVFDVPAMRPFFDEVAAERGVADRVEFFGGDFFVDEIPSADVVIIGHVLHDWDAEQRGQLVRKAFDAVSPGGALVVYDRMLDEDARHVENLVISLDMLLVTDGGSEYTAEELIGHASAAGFTDITASPLGDYDTLVVAHKR